MFGRLATVRLKTAEDAFAAGRIDEAFDVVASPDLAGQRRAQELLRGLFLPFLERGQDHLLNRRFTEALADFDRAGRCGVQSEKLAQWRARAKAASQEAVGAKREREEALAAARQHMQSGSLAGAEAVLAGVPAADPERCDLAGAISAQAERARAALDAAGSALAAGAMGTALERFRAARQLHPRMQGVAEMEAKLIERVVAQAAESFRDGRLHRMEQELALLDDVGRDRPERLEMENALQLAREAAAAVEQGRYAHASVLLGRLNHMGPRAAWLNDAGEDVDKLEEYRRKLLEGPLGILTGRNGSPVARMPNAETMVASPPPRPVAPAVRAAPPVVANGLPSRLWLRIDGVGSFLLLRSERISIGRAGPGASADIQLISDLSDRQAEVVRAGEDYFVMAASGVELAGRAVEHALLQHGDRIRLGHRVRLRFMRPSQKSGTAVLELSDGVRMTSDCRRAILLGGPLMIGGRKECHVQLRPNSGDAILVERDGVLTIRPMAPGTPATAIALGTQFEVGGLRMSVQPWPDGASGGRVIG